MQGASASPVLSLSPSSPSFSSYSSASLAEIAARVVEEFRQQEPEDSEDMFDINWERERERQQEEDRRGSCLDDDDDDDVVLFSQQKHEQEEEEEEEEFEFAVVCNKKQECSSVTADEIFFNGQIKPLYPLFNRDLLLYNYDQNNDAAPSPAPAASPTTTTTTTTTGRSSNRLPLGKLMSEERETSVSCSCSSSEADDLDNLTPGTYCVWTPKPSKESQSPGRSCKKSHSTGSNSKRWKFRDLLYRSNSDGKDTFVFFTPLVTGNHHNKKTTAAARHRHHRHQDTQDYNKSSSGSATGTGKAANKATVNKEHYVRNRSVKEENKKRSFLPYRHDLVGFFSNVNM